MTTSSANNLVFKGFFEKQKLTGPKFIDWYRQLRILLSIEDNLNYLEQPIPPTSVVHVGQHVAPEILVAHTTWIKGSKEIDRLMLMTMEPYIQQNLETLHDHEMLLELNTLFAQQAEQELLQTTRDFHSCKQEEGQPVSLYVLKMKGYIDNLERLGNPVTLGLGVSLFLIGLRKEFDGFVQNYNMHSLRKTINELPAMLKLYEQTLPKNNAHALHVIQAGRVQNVNKHKKSQPQMVDRGQNHGKGKNKQAYAPKPNIPPPPKREDPAKDSICHECASGAGCSGIFVIELNTILNRSWIYDTRCGTHICNTTQGLRASRKLKPRSLSLYVGNGQRKAIVAIGFFYLCLPSGLEIVLNNCHYAPSITRGVISVFCLYEDGFINLFVNNTIQVSRNNMVYFNAIPRDGIFEIDLSNSYTNETSIFAVGNKRAKLDLDSALMWHYRLGHISKTRIEKLQHDGLLNLIDLRAFEKCVSCISGKMARKPYTHQVERAKDILGLIHTDDIAHRTPPYTPQHNGVSERRNRTLLDMVRSMMSQTTLRKSFWDYALETAACILNMVLTKKVEKAPYEVWHGQAPKLSYLKVWGCEALVKQDTLTKPDKLEPISIKCIFIGHPKETTRYSFYYPPDNKVLVARNAKFLENSLITQETSRSLEDLEIIQEEDTHPSINTSLNHKDDDLEIDEPQSDIVPIRRSTRTRHAPDRMCLYIDAEEHELGDLAEPANYKAALLDPNKWLFKKNTDLDKVIHTYKARLVAKGYTQTPRIDYEETFSQVADIRAIRILIAITAYYDYEIWQMDVKTAFLNGYLNEERYCMENSKRGSIPMQEKLKLSKSQGASTPAELKRMQNVPYALAVGSIMYTVRYTRLDVAFAQNVTSRFQQLPSDLHWTIVKNILKYLRNTKDMFLVYRGDLKESSGFLATLMLDIWRMLMTSSLRLDPSEYIAAFDVSKEAVWVRKFIYGLGVVPTIKEPITMYCDNTGAIAIANESGITKGARHFRVKVHHLCEVIEYGDVKLEKVYTDDNFVNPFTKALAFPKHLEHTRNIGMLPASSLI
nr:hypothetical protein [Tanacetum cinerariifolium]